MSKFTLFKELVYVIEPKQQEPRQLSRLLRRHPEIAFASLFAVDIAGNDIDEKIPIRVFGENLHSLLSGGVQTDGSSVVLPGIACLNDAKVDLLADGKVNWYIDYNYENRDEETGLPLGTLRIPSFLLHNGRKVCSRALLERALDSLNERGLKLLQSKPELCSDLGVDVADFQALRLAAATELEFWVRTPDDIVSSEALASSQGLKEQYWKRTKGVVRTALEQSLRLMELYGFHPEMGHKEVGGVKAHLNGSGNLDHIMEQLEIDWAYSTGIQAADNELTIRILIKEVFRLHGLEVSFLAKPLPKVAGSGEHTHINLAATLRNGKGKNLFAPAEFNASFLSRLGWASLLGICKHYRELIAPFVSASIDAFNRLRPGFEAPTHLTVSLGGADLSPSRNRTVLLGLVRNPESPEATRFELRSPHPHSNSYFTLASLSQCMLAGLEMLVDTNLSLSALEAEINKEANTPASYLAAEQRYRCEEDLFEIYTAAERDRLFGQPAATVYDTLRSLVCSEQLEVLYAQSVFSEALIHSYVTAMLNQWERELAERSLVDDLSQVRSCVFKGSDNSYDDAKWAQVEELKRELAKNSSNSSCLFTQLRAALEEKNYREASALQTRIREKMEVLLIAYQEYKSNLLA